jgi:pimeloyl-ACP methyl ester carboxylesterase
MARAAVSTAALALWLGGCPSGDDGAGGDATDDPTIGSSGEPTSAATEGEPSGTSDATAGTSGSSGTAGDTTAGEPTTDASTDGDETGIPTEPGPDLRVTGPYDVMFEPGNVVLPGCNMPYDLRWPAGVPDAPVVVLAHGFQGNRASMAGWAEHWASWGVRVVTPNLCHATILDTDHAQNGADLRGLVAALSLPSPIYAGYSAGGLAAVVATADDPQAVALLGLDMVDNASLGAGAAASVAVPAFVVVGEPSQCNTTNNGLAVFAAMPNGRALRVTEADHCDFQDPADFLCGITCSGSNNQWSDAEIQAAVRGLSTAVVLWQAGLEPTGAQWWTPGEHYYDLLAGLGIIEAP